MSESIFRLWWRDVCILITQNGGFPFYHTARKAYEAGMTADQFAAMQMNMQPDSDELIEAERSVFQMPLIGRDTPGLKWLLTEAAKLRKEFFRNDYCKNWTAVALPGCRDAEEARETLFGCPVYALYVIRGSATRATSLLRGPSWAIYHDLSCGQTTIALFGDPDEISSFLLLCKLAGE